MRNCSPKRCLFPSCGKNICCSLCDDKKCKERCVDDATVCKYITTDNGIIINRNKPKIEVRTLSYLKENCYTNCLIEETSCHLKICCKFCENFKSCENACQENPVQCKYITIKPRLPILSFPSFSFLTDTYSILLYNKTPSKARCHQPLRESLLFFSVFHFFFDRAGAAAISARPFLLDVLANA